MCICARGFIHRVHGKMFGLKPEQIDQILYGLLAFYKIMFITFILVPWIALVIMT
jgi:hypothetical protein